MEFMIGIQGDGFILVACDSSSGRSIVRMKDGKVVSLFIAFGRFAVHNSEVRSKTPQYDSRENRTVKSCYEVEMDGKK